VSTTETAGRDTVARFGRRSVGLRPTIRAAHPMAGLLFGAVFATLAGAACAGGEDADPESGADAPAVSRAERDGPRAERPIADRLAAAEEATDQLADSLDDLLHPVPLLTAAQEGAFGRYGNADHLDRAAALGIDPDAPAPGALVPLDSSGPYWIVRELDHSEPLVTPATHALLEEIGRRFQARLEDEGLPAYRFEITSALRTAEAQADLRRTNPNAVTGRSAHEYGTTVDITYAAFAAPLSGTPAGADDGGSGAVAGAAEAGAVRPEAGEVRPEAGEVAPEADSAGMPAWLEAHIGRDEAARLETVAARRSRELQAFLGEELLALQAGGAAYVMLEVRQPVFHITLTR